ncbi:hypothetical protein PILCRDRAFT_594512 [Piloderma croceum F 1598]|uniref:Uncharacterized protein n=1 Tax=Piloderma croceum (strain F 1598) TaxID=765440 RepID=A0A0C3FEB0_PILCF|nr:hypothetical protein PILCRDRAFT_594512 [Piloderma croceum F 1598]
MDPPFPTRYHTTSTLSDHINAVIECRCMTDKCRDGIHEANLSTCRMSRLNIVLDLLKQFSVPAPSCSLHTYKMC